MALNFPTLEQIVARIQNDVQTELNNSNPFLDNSFLKATIVSYAGRFEEFYLQAQTLFNNLFLSTTSNDFLDAWGVIFQLQRLAPTPSEGDVFIEGVITTPLTTLPIGTIIQGSTGINYETTAVTTIDSVVKSSVNGNISAEIVTLTITDHKLGTGNTITVSGGSSAELNGTFSIVATDLNTIQYTAVGSVLSGPISGLTVTYIGGSVAIVSQETGSNTISNDGERLSLLTPVPGVNSRVFPSYGGIIGGRNLESDDDYRKRVLTRLQNPVSDFSESTIIEKALEVSGVTRIWVDSPIQLSPPVGSPAPGEVYILFVFDGQDPITPNSGEIDTMKAKIDEITPANIVKPSIGSDNVKVIAPTLAVQNISIASLQPNIATLKDAIEANLEAYFKDEVELSRLSKTGSETLLKLDLESTILNTVDPISGERVLSFTLVAPASDVSVANHNLPVLGTVTYV